MKINLVVATSENGTIGKDGHMPWNMPTDLKQFKKITTSESKNVVIMGRKTYDSIGKALPGRINVVISSNENLDVDGWVFKSLQDAIDSILGWEYFTKKEYSTYIIGGASIYNQAIDSGIVETVYHTLIKGNIDGDTVFDVPKWSLVSEEHPEKSTEDSHECVFRILKKPEN
jgi:dihydrofolate reductase